MRRLLLVVCLATLLTVLPSCDAGNAYRKEVRDGACSLPATDPALQRYEATLNELGSLWSSWMQGGGGSFPPLAGEATLMAGGVVRPEIGDGLTAIDPVCRSLYGAEASLDAVSIGLVGLGVSVDVFEDRAGLKASLLFYSTIPGEYTLYKRYGGKSPEVLQLNVGGSAFNTLYCERWRGGQNGSGSTAVIGSTTDCDLWNLTRVSESCVPYVVTAKLSTTSQSGVSNENVIQLLLPVASELATEFDSHTNQLNRCPDAAGSAEPVVWKPLGD